MKTCTPIFTPSNNIFGYLLEPTIISSPSDDLVGYLRDKINSNHWLPVIGNNEFLDMLSAAETNSATQSDYTKAIDHAINKRMASAYNVMSVFDKFQHLMVLSACYRMLHILSISLQHKIALSNYRKSTKFILTAFTALAPFAIMSYMGYISTELVIVSLLTSLSPYVLSNKWSNKIREIDLISTTKEFIFKNSLLNCCLSSLKNISSTLLLDLTGLFLSSVYFTSSDPQEFKSLANAFTIRHNVEVCRFTHLEYESSYSYSVLTPAHFVTRLLMCEAGWCLGRLAIDLGMGLLQKVNIISDARDPFYNSTFKGRAQKPAHAPTQPAARKRLKGKERREGEEAPESHQYALPQQSNRRVKKQKPVAPQAETKHLPQHVARANEDLPVIRVPDYTDQPLVPFYPFAQSEATYGVVANPKARHFNEFTTTLNRAHNEVANPNGYVECLDPGKQVFSLRPNLDARLLGQKVTGQEDVAYALNRVYPYERAWVAMDKIQETIGTLTVVPFSKQTNHSNYPRTLALFA